MLCKFHKDKITQEIKKAMKCNMKENRKKTPKNEQKRQPFFSMAEQSNLYTTSASKKNQ